MSIRDLSQPCPHCGDRGPFFLIKNGDYEPYDPKLPFSVGYKCGLCFEYFEARESDKQSYPEEYVVRNREGKRVPEADREYEVEE